MEIKYKNKPSQELIEKYCRKLEKFLSAYELSVSIDLWEVPLRLESYVDGNITEIKNIWIKEIKIKSPKVDELNVTVFKDSIDESLDERQIWNDAWHIQDQMYKHLNLVPKLSSDPNWKDDPYWKLWDHLERTKK